MPNLEEILQGSAPMWLLLLLLKGTLILLLSQAALRLLRDSSASIRHLARTCTLSLLVLLPVTTLLVPSWELPWLAPPTPGSPTQPAPPAAPPSEPAVEHADAPAAVAHIPVSRSATTPAATPEPGARPDTSNRKPGISDLQFALSAFPVPGSSLFLLLWSAGALLLAARLLLGFVCVRRAIARARPVDDPLWLDLSRSAAAALGLRRPVRLLIGDKIEVALSVGFREPVILLPEVARTWSVSRLRSILLHELAHAKRGDNLTNLAGQLACLLHWPNPLVWLAARGLVVDRERACDDEVLASGTRPSEYAGHLLEIARAVAQRRFWGRLEISQSSALKDRFKALLDPRLRRHFPGAAGRLSALALSALLLFPLAALQPWTTSEAAAGTAVSSPGRPGFLSVAARFSRIPAAGTPGGPEASFTGQKAEPPFGAAGPETGVPERSGPSVRQPSDRDVAERRAWPGRRVSTSPRLTPTARALWSEAPPHRTLGVTQPQPAPPVAGGAVRSAGAGGRIVLPRRPQEEPQRPPVEPRPRQPVLRAEVTRLELGTLGGTESAAADVNDAGLVVGRSQAATGLNKPFAWSASTGLVDLGVGLQMHSRALQVNEGGVVLVETFNARLFAGFVWTADTGLIDLGALNPSRPFTLPSAVSERGHVSGASRDAAGVLRPILWTPTEGMIDLGAPEWGEARALNEHDQVVGYSGSQAFLWDREEGFRLVGPEDSALSIATAVNHRGHVVGYADFGEDFPEAFVWTPATGTLRLGTLGPEYPISFALSIDDQGQVTGRSVSAPREGLPERARLFRWTPAGGMQDLGPAGAADELAINALGQIVAAFGDGSAATERSLAVLWTEQGPIPVDLDQGLEGGSQSQVAAINNKGLLVGSSLGADARRLATLWEVRLIREEEE